MFSNQVQAVSKRPSSLMDKPSSIPHTRIEDESVIEAMFSMGKKLGQGNFGIVREAVNVNTDKRWAVKAVNKEKAGSSAVKLLEREVMILKRVNHEHIIHLEQVFETSKKMYLVMELCEHGELADLLKQQHHFSEDKTRIILRDLASAISYLHKNDIVHRDLKLENILVHINPKDDSPHIKVTDFGLSVVQDGVGHENMMQQFCGTPIYMPPEIVDNKTYSQQCDVWAMGVITYYMLAGSPPFKARDEETLYDLIKKAEVRCDEEYIKVCSKDAHNCIQGMLKVDPAHRLTASEVLHHTWITGEEKVEGATGNVLELMKQWKDELSDEECEHGNNLLKVQTSMVSISTTDENGNKSDHLHKNGTAITVKSSTSKTRSPGKTSVTSQCRYSTNKSPASSAVALRTSYTSNTNSHSRYSPVHHVPEHDQSSVISTNMSERESHSAPGKKTQSSPNSHPVSQKSSKSSKLEKSPASDGSSKTKKR